LGSNCERHGASGLMPPRLRPSRRTLSGKPYVHKPYAGRWRYFGPFLTAGPWIGGHDSEFWEHLSTIGLVGSLCAPQFLTAGCDVRCLLRLARASFGVRRCTGQTVHRPERLWVGNEAESFRALEEKGTLLIRQYVGSNRYVHACLDQALFGENEVSLNLPLSFLRERRLRFAIH